MNFLVDINHPGQVHLFRNLINNFKTLGNVVIVTIKDIPEGKKLLDLFDIDYFDIGKKSDNLFGKALDQLKYNWKIWRLLRKYDIDIALGSSISVDHACLLHKAKSIHLSDDDAGAVPLTVKYAYPFTNTILCPDCLSFEKFTHKQIQYAGYHELAYLHPNRFTPTPKVLEEIGLRENETFFIMRFNVFRAHHDIGIKGLSFEQKLKLIELLEPYGKIFITTEREIEPELKKYQLLISSEKIHSLMYYATMLIGDSQTMTSEAAVLGIPAIRCNDFVGRISYLEEEEHKYNLAYGFKPYEFDKMIIKIKELINIPNLKQEWQKRRQRMLAEKIDVTAFMVWFIENYPESVKIMKENPDYQYRFK